MYIISANYFFLSGLSRSGNRKKERKEKGRMLCFQKMKKNFRKGKKKDWAVWKLYFKEQLLWELKEKKNLT